MALCYMCPLTEALLQAVISLFQDFIVLLATIYLYLTEGLGTLLLVYRDPELASRY